MYRRKKCLREELDKELNLKQWIAENKYDRVMDERSGIEYKLSDGYVCVSDLEAFMAGKVVVDADWLKKLWNMAETQPVLKHEIEAMLSTQEGE